MALLGSFYGSIKPLKGCYYTQERQSQERQDFRGRFDFAFQSALDSASAALSARLLLLRADVTMLALFFGSYGAVVAIL